MRARVGPGLEQGIWTYANGLEHRAEPGQVQDAVAQRVDRGLEEVEGCAQGGHAVAVV